ncbi:MAG TPA: M67 family metallopeptidase [bacterium]|nr:M67 family metallopeptidase [bacterium]
MAEGKRPALTLRLSAPAWAAVQRHAESGYPHEVCGILIGQAGDQPSAAEAHPCSNVNKERARDRYLMDPQEQMRLEKDARNRGLDVLGYYHSHPDHPAVASATDNQLSWESVHYLIVAVRDGKVVDHKAWWRDPGSPGLGEENLQLP